MRRLTYKCPRGILVESSFEYETCSRDISGYWLDNGKVFNLKGTCLTGDELWNYIKSGNGYAIHITKLEIFDKPKEISEFKNHKHLSYADGITTHSYHIERYTCLSPLTRAPESYCYIEV